jgi:peptidoglycan/xylan/chitin deacetylase (PgdA/CDA1 family)
MLDRGRLRELSAAGVEVGGHTHSHPELDTLPARLAAEDITRGKATLEAELETPIRSFAYPHGYSSPTVRRLVQAAGYDSACAVGEALADPDGDPFRITRLTVRASNTTSEVSEWIRGTGRPLAPRSERIQTRAWRTYRRCAVRVGVRPAVAR